MAQKFAWLKLYVMVAAACGALWLEARLDVPQGVHQVLLFVWIVAAYGMISLWVNKNPDAVPTAPIKIPVQKTQVDELFDVDRAALQTIFEEKELLESMYETEAPSSNVK